MPKPPFVLRRSLEERRQLLPQHSSCRARSMAEVVGGTTAEVTAVCCCFPCAAVDFTFLAMYKVPAGICRNAMRRRRRRRLMMHRDGGGGGGGGGREGGIEEELAMHPAVIAAAERFMDKDVMALEDEMWEKFSETGFWRSPSQRNK